MRKLKIKIAFKKKINLNIEMKESKMKTPFHIQCSFLFRQFLVNAHTVDHKLVWCRCT